MSTPNPDTPKKDAIEKVSAPPVPNLTPATPRRTASNAETPADAASTSASDASEAKPAAPKPRTTPKKTAGKPAARKPATAKQTTGKTTARTTAATPAADETAPPKSTKAKTTTTTSAPKAPAPKSSARKAPARKPAAKASAGIPEAKRSEIAADIAALEMGTKVWATLTLNQRATLLKHTRDAIADQAQAWVDVSNASKGIEADHPLAGEEWLTGPYATLNGIDTLQRTVAALARGIGPLDDVKTSIAPTGQVKVHAFPATKFDSILLSGFTGEVWLSPGVSVDQAQRHAGLGQLTPQQSGGIGLVLGAGNQPSIPVLDVLYELLAFNRVVLLKVNPTQDALVPIYKRALAPLIEPGFVRIVTGSGDVGAYLTASDAFSHVHITGSAATFDAIVWGTGAEATKNRAAGTPKLTTPITGELGGVAPVIIVPGQWTAADLDYQAEHVVTMRLQNSGHNCLAGQVVILSKNWAQKQDFVDALRRAYAKAPGRPVWYPNSEAKLDGARAAYPDAEQYGSRILITPEENHDSTTLETTEFFAPVLGVVEIPGTDQQFVNNAVAYANDKLVGTLGANVIIDPATEARLGAGFERAIADLHYGNIAINAWTGVSFTASTLSWGAFPGHTLEDVGSGIGIVHNALLIDDIERSVLRGPFRPFPRSVGKGTFTVLPKPPWFVTSRTGAAVSEGLTRYLISPNPLGLAKTLALALRA